MSTLSGITTPLQKHLQLLHPEMSLEKVDLILKDVWKWLQVTEEPDRAFHCNLCLHYVNDDPSSNSFRGLYCYKCHYTLCDSCNEGLTEGMYPESTCVCGGNFLYFREI